MKTFVIVITLAFQNNTYDERYSMSEFVNEEDCGKYATAMVGEFMSQAPYEFGYWTCVDMEKVPFVDLSDTKYHETF